MMHLFWHSTYSTDVSILLAATTNMAGGMRAMHIKVPII